MEFEKALKKAKKGKAIRLNHWEEGQLVKAQYPTDTSKMTAPYLFCDNQFGLVPWIPTQIEMFSSEWEVVKLDKFSWASDDWHEAHSNSVI